MIPILAQGLLVAGTVILWLALIPVRQLMQCLPQGPVRSRWYLMTVFITLFIAGYLGYGWVYWQSHSRATDLIVPLVFFFGACFVLLTSALSLQTAKDVLRISVLERETATDPLTGVHNRRYMEQCFNTEFASANRYGQPLCVLMLDIDHFKRINDTYGHQIGDQVLIDLGKILRLAVRETDVVARYGGEEFVVITPHTTLEGAITLAERMRKAIESHGVALPNDAGVITVTASFGVATLTPEVKNSESLVHLADMSLYRAKQEGRNRVVASLV
jgi:diguanylate cyclase (GGDEF)-like protein